VIVKLFITNLRVLKKLLGPKMAGGVGAGEVCMIRSFIMCFFFSRYSQSSLFAGVRFLGNPVNTENANMELFDLHLHYA
jgi:hypothetical protein